MPPGTEAILDSSILENAGLFGALMLFMIVILVIFLWYLWRMSRDWQSYIGALWSRMDSRLQIEAERRSDAMQHGMSDVQRMIDAIGEQSRQIQIMANSIQRHDQGATARHGQLMAQLGDVSSGISDRNYQRMMDLIRYQGLDDEDLEGGHVPPFKQETSRTQEQSAA